MPALLTPFAQKSTAHNPQNLYKAIYRSALNLPIYTRVGAEFDFQEVPIYEHPYTGSPKIGSLLWCYHGLCSATLIKNLGDWYLIEDGVMGERILFTN